MALPAVLGVVAKTVACDMAARVISDEKSFSGIQGTAGYVSLGSAFAAAAGMAAAPVAATLGAGMGTTALLGTVGVALGASCLPLALAAGALWAGMALVQSTGTRETLGRSVGTFLSPA